MKLDVAGLEHSALTDCELPTTMVTLPEAEPDVALPIRDALQAVDAIDGATVRACRTLWPQKPFKKRERRRFIMEEFLVQ
jgi:hypothetical protein